MCTLYICYVDKRAPLPPAKPVKPKSFVIAQLTRKEAGEGNIQDLGTRRAEREEKKGRGGIAMAFEIRGQQLLVWEGGCEALRSLQEAGARCG